MTKITVGILKLLSYLPFPFLYFFSSGLAFFTNSILGYRKKVILKNFEHSFPEKNKNEINELVARFYLFLSDLVVETLKSFSISRELLKEKVQFQHTEVLEQFAHKKQPIIIIMGHYGNWELIGLTAGFSESVNFYSLYREQKNKAINTFIKNNRQRFGLHLISEKHAVRKIPSLLQSNEANALCFIADQAVSPKRAHWIRFLNQEATFVKGPALYAKKYNCPVLFAGVECSQRGIYKPYYKLICKSAATLSEEEITKRFATELEKMIRKNPPFWLWSHRRWKHHK